MRTRTDMTTSQIQGGAWQPGAFGQVEQAGKVGRTEIHTDRYVPPALPSPEMFNRQAVKDFYAAFSAKDGARMAEAYAPHAKFSDGAFPNLDGVGAGAMWRMLTQSEGLEVVHTGTKVDGDRATATWTARYPHPVTGRPVENHVTSNMRFENGKIVEQRDDFDMKEWLRQGFGGWAGLPGISWVLTKATQFFAGRSLDKFRAENG